MNKFDELTKSMAQAVTRREAVKRFGVGVAAMALACFGLANTADAGVKTCATNADCQAGQVCCQGACWDRPTWCDPAVSCCCYCAGSGKHRYPTTALTPCDSSYNTCWQTCSNGGTLLGCPGTWI
jgi:hypothetical protein